VNNPAPAAHLPSVSGLTLNCLVYGDDPRHVFPVKIANGESVGSLKKTMKENKVALDHVDADALTLWNVSIPDDDGFRENASKFEPIDDNALRPMTLLNQIFPVTPRVGDLHIIVHCESPFGRCCI
jgi:hypothetical protein